MGKMLTPIIKKYIKNDIKIEKGLKKIMRKMDRCKENTMGSWAKKEIEIACKREKELTNNDKNEWDYGVACYESAHRAFKSLYKDGHSGYSINFTKYILNCLIDGKPLTPIEDTDDVWRFTYEENNKKTYQCTRMGSLFKKVYADGRIEYNDVDSNYCVDIDNPTGTYTSGLVNDVMKEFFPITMPYIPPTNELKFYCERFLVDPSKGDWDTAGILYVIKDDKKIKINRFYKEVDDHEIIKISKKEYQERYLNRINPLTGEKFDV